MKQNGNINIEYEARAMITEAQYQAILKAFEKEKNIITSENINTYFDYEDIFLTDNHMVLRVREINKKEREVTLKIKCENGDKEINYPLTYNQYLELLNNLNNLPSEIRSELELRKVNLNKLKNIASLKTKRVEIPTQDGLLVIDQNEYNNKIDYNVEVESTSKSLAISLLNQYFAPFGVTYKNGYISKSRRAIYKL